MTGRLLRRAAGIAALVVLTGLLAAGCGKHRNVLVADVPPETTLFVRGPVDTVNHVVHLYWFGSDPDGYVTGFELRFFNPSSPADTQWAFTTRTDSLITVYTPTGFAAPRFEVRAIDDKGLKDETPAVEDFSFSNQAPSVRLLSPPRTADTTFASVTLTWQPIDPDGDVAKLTYRVWLDGNQASARTLTRTTYTIPTDDFRQGGALLSGYRTVYVEPTDDGGRVGALDSTRWYVRAPVTGNRARLLIVDDVPRAVPSNFATDTMFSNTAARNLPPGTWSILRLEFTQPFRSAEDVEQTFKLFESVIWYRGTQTSLPTLLARYQDGIAAYLDAGGRFMAEGLDLIDGAGSAGALSGDWVSRYFGSDYLYRNEVPGTPGDSTVAWGINNGAVLRSSVFQDSLRMAGIFSGLRAFALRDTANAIIWARVGVLAQGNPWDAPVAVSVPQPSGGRAIAVTVPLRGANGFLTVPRVLARIFQQLGLTGP